MSALAGPSTQAKPQQSARTRADPKIQNQTSVIKDPANMVTKAYKRSRNGCYTCRLRRKKCDETHPNCVACTSLGVSCEYRKPSWWISTQARMLQKDKIKQKVRETKVLQKEVALQAKPRDNPVSKPQSPPVEPMMATTYDSSTSYLPAPATGALMSTPYGFDAGIGSSTYIPDTTYVPDTTPLQDTSVFWFDPTATPLIPTPTSISELSASSAAMTATTTTTTTAMTTPAVQSDEWYQGFTDPLPRVQNPLSLGSSEFPDRPLSFYLEGKMSSNDRERSLLYHFVDNVLRLVFPILDLHKQGPSRAREILRSLDSNKSYYHGCLSVSAIHLRTVKKQRGKRVERDIMRHRYAAISELHKALYADHGHDTILDATLAMIFFHCSVGSPEVDGLPDIGWNEHFTAVTDLVNKLGLMDANPFTPPPFSMSLSTWIDIFGATMLGRSPQFAHAYRHKHLNGISSGLRELMGCDDRIMYLISEIACLDSLKEEGRISDYTVCHHVSALTAQLDHAEQVVVNPTLENPISATGIIQADKLTKNMTAIFRVAARIYLYSLMPGFHPEQQNIIDLVEKVSELLQYIPSGPFGFDRSLVWPMLITGAFSTPTSNFRIILEQRIAALGDCSDFGSFGRMYSVLQETWKLSDDDSEPVYTERTSGFLGPPSSSAFEFDAHMAMPSPALAVGAQRVKQQPIHWRDVMRAREWHYLLL
ncbi:Zn(II)2Cys6 transcription factor [Aspergillus foveolatus]|uniref:Zn(II)2Cys6 transcription factor n=1 Tax=Aspergillus foveolatus TaxID=210207 RepID=UPI003CCCB0D3